MVYFFSIYTVKPTATQNAMIKLGWKILAPIAIFINVFPVKIVTNNFSGSSIIFLTLLEKFFLCFRILKYAVSDEEKNADNNNNIKKPIIIITISYDNVAYDII